MELKEALKECQQLLRNNIEIKNDSIRILCDVVNEEVTLSTPESDEDECDWCNDFDGNRTQILSVRKSRADKGKTGLEVLLLNHANGSKKWSEIEHTSTDALQLLNSVLCELEYRQAQDDDEVEISIWDKGYSEDEIAGCEIVTWPESQDVMECDGSRDHCWLINDEEGLDLYGSSAYVVEKDWYRPKTE